MAGKYRDIFYFLNKYVFSILPDSLYHNLIFWIMHKRVNAKSYWMDIKKPKKFSEKLQWLKTNGDISLKSKLADKFLVRDFVRQRIGDQYLISLHPLNKKGEFCINNVESIDWDVLPDKFALKLTKGSGYNIICNDKKALDIDKIQSKLKKWLNINNYYLSREPQYIGKNGLICEVLLEYNIKDYKFFCFNGVPKFLKVDFDRVSSHHANYYDLSWNLLDLNELCCPRNPNVLIPKPLKLEEMISLVSKLAQGFPFVRVDLYIHKERVYFGEMTFHPSGGYTLWEPKEWEDKIGQLLSLPS